MADRNTKIRGNQILDGTIMDAEIGATAAIAESKLDLAYSTSTLNEAIGDHIDDTNNPHSVTKAQVLTGDLIINADIDPAAAIEASKLAIANSPTDGYVLAWVGGSDGTMTWIEDVLPAAQVVQADFVGSETANETPDAIIVNFTHDSAAIAASVQVYLNGLLQQPGEGKDYVYTVGSKQAAFVVAPDTGDIVIFCYVKS
jgi:hypothetical protein